MPDRSRATIRSAPTDWGRDASRVLIEKPVAAVNELLFDYPENKAAREGARVANNFDEITGIRSALSAVQGLVSGNFTTDNALASIPIVAPVAGRAALPARGLFGRPVQAPAPLVKNRLYGGTVFNPAEKLPQAAGLPKYAFRNVSNIAEVEDILRSGFMRPAPHTNRADKYFSLSDNPLGNPSNLGGQKPVLRVATDYIPKGSPISARHVEVWDNALRRFVPILSYRRAR